MLCFWAEMEKMYLNVYFFQSQIYECQVFGKINQIL